MKCRNQGVIALFLIAGLFLVGGTTAQAEDFAKVGTTGSNFLKIPIGARGVAMGNAFASLSDDNTAMFWNPAGMVYVDRKYTVMFERINWLADISYNVVGATYKFGSFQTLGAFVGSLDSGEIERTTVMQPNGTGDNFSVTNMVAGVSVATILTEKFSVGANLKYVREDLDGEVAGNYAVDIGTMYDTRWNTLRLSMSIRNFGPEIQLDGTYRDYDNGTLLEEEKDFLAYHYPLIFKLGVAGDPIRTDLHRLTLVGELEHPNDNIERVNLGGEYAFQELFFLRGGYTLRHDTRGLSAGVGFSWTNFTIDYAFSDYGILEAVHRFGIRFGF